MSVANLTSLIIHTLGNQDIDVFGIVPAEAFSEAPPGHHPQSILPTAATVIIFGIPHLKGTYLSTTTEPYAFIRNALADKINQMSMALAYRIESQGYEAIPVDAIGPTTKDATGRSRGIISLKHTAELAGLGSFGKNTLILNRTYGNRLWFGAVITSAPLQPTQHAHADLCIKKCTKCIDACKVSALLQVSPFIHQADCWHHAFDDSDERLQITCFECRRVCPLRFGITDTVSDFPK
jgi:epoxyqueuosine reductase QueG